MSSSLKLEWATHKAAKYACTHWHYSRSMPSAQCKVGVWENDKFIGVVLFGIGAGASTNGSRYGLSAHRDVAELVRVALKPHDAPVSKIVSIALRMMKKANPGIRIVISFADEMGQGHIGGIYQAGNWIYAGAFEGDGGFIIHGKPVHTRTVTSRQGWKASLGWLRKYVDPNATKNKTKKHRYLMPMDSEMRQRLQQFSKPYPKRSKQAMAGPPAQRRGGTDPNAPISTSPSDGGKFNK